MVLVVLAVVDHGGDDEVPRRLAQPGYLPRHHCPWHEWRPVRCTVLYCGPTAFRDALRTGLRQHGLSARNFRYEAFEIRTGIGLKALLAYLTRRGGAVRQRVS